MRLRLWQRLFIAFATLSVLALAGFAAWQQQAFRHGFLGYLDDVAIERLQPASARLADAYVAHGSWDFLRDRPDRFVDLIDDRLRPPRDDGAMSPPVDAPPPPDAPFHHIPRPLNAVPDDRPPPPPGLAFGDGAPPDEAMPGERPPREGPPPHRPHGPPDLMPRLSLVDANGTRIVGHPSVPADAPAIPIEANGRRVGAILLAPQPRPSDDVDIAFAHAQLRSALIAAIGVLMGAFALAFAFARGLLKPVNAIAHGTRALAAGDYTRRLAIDRGDELGALAADFNHLAAALEQNRAARRRWGADIAHELRTPLSILRGEIDALRDGVRAPSREALESLHAECARLGALIDDLYELSLADAGALEYRFEVQDLGALVSDALETQRRACSDAGLALEAEIADDVAIRGDAQRIVQLVDNLLANARRYTDAPGRVRVAVDAVGDTARIVVDDTPPGVPADALPRLFERLFRVEDSRSRAAGGAGLGLAICRAIVEAHGGRIAASASPLGGLRISIEIPSVQA